MISIWPDEPSEIYQVMNKSKRRQILHMAADQIFVPLPVYWSLYQRNKSYESRYRPNFWQTLHCSWEFPTLDTEAEFLCNLSPSPSVGLRFSQCLVSGILSCSAESVKSLVDIYFHKTCFSDRVINILVVARISDQQPCVSFPYYCSLS